jgi:hypothetical protein
MKKNMIDGTFTDTDLMLYNHEVTERRLMNDEGLDYFEAHEKANEEFPWSAVMYGKGK